MHRNVCLILQILLNPANPAHELTKKMFCGILACGSMSIHPIERIQKSSRTSGNPVGAVFNRAYRTHRFLRRILDLS